MDSEYDAGSFLIRACGSDWKYCNGRCSTCNETRYTFSATSNPGREIATRGTPNYMVKRRSIDPNDI